MYRFTVFTPSFNRAHTLPRVYESLKRQTFRDFEWLIVDDGSTDKTRELVERWQRDNPFPIRYFWQENAHKKAAFNHGVKEAKGQLLWTLDSDDEAKPDALEILNRHWCSIPERQRVEFSAVTGLCEDEQGKVIGDKFHKDMLDSNSLEVRYRYRIGGDKSGFQRTNVLRQHLFPESVHGHVPEGIVWSAIASRYRTRYVNDVVLRVYRNGSDSITTQSRPGRNADGHALWAREVLCNEWRWFLFNPKWFLKMAANYTRFHLHLNRQQTCKRWHLKGVVPYLLVILMWPVGYIRYRLDVFKADN